MFGFSFDVIDVMIDFPPTGDQKTHLTPPYVSSDFEPKGGGLIGIYLLIGVATKRLRWKDNGSSEEKSVNMFRCIQNSEPSFQ